MRIDIGLWRSARGDTHPHVGLDVKWDYWPQATHVVWEAPALVSCMTGGGGGSQQAMFRRELDPLLASALERWRDSPVIGTPTHSLERWFAEVQAGFEALVEPAWAAELQATGVAVLVRDDGAAVGNVGLDRAYRYRRDWPLAQLTVDDSLAKRSAPAQVPEWFRHSSAAALRKARPDLPDYNRWTVSPLAVTPGDVLLLITGLADTGLTDAYLKAALDELFEATPPIAGAQDLADRLGAVLTRFGEVSSPESRAEWRIHSRVALAIVWVD